MSSRDRVAQTNKCNFGSDEMRCLVRLKCKRKRERATEALAIHTHVAIQINVPAICIRKDVCMRDCSRAAAAQAREQQSMTSSKFNYVLLAVHERTRDIHTSKRTKAE